MALVAEKADVSIGTVSRVFNRAADVTADLRERVWTVSRELGFVPKTRRRTVAVVLGSSGIYGPVGYMNTMLAGLTKELANHGYLTEVVELEDLAAVWESQIDGVVGLVFDDRITELTAIPNLPILTINDPLLEHGIHSISSDHFQQGVLATEHLLKHGHRQIAFLEKGAESWSSRMRLAGYRQTLKKAGVTANEGLIAYADGNPLYDTLDMLVRRGATALLNFGEDTCLETLHVLSNIMRLAIPKNISVVTMENLPVFKYMNPPQTVITQPLEELARCAAEKIIEQCNRKDGYRDDLVNITLPCALVERASVSSIDAV